MRNMTYALLISGIFTVMLAAPAFALEAAGYSDHGKWRPVQGRDSQKREQGQPGPDPWAKGNDYPRHRQQSYNFRPWDGFRGQNNRVSTYRAPKTGAAPFNYRFRPIDRQRRAVAPMKWTYRPTQIDIPNHYVYRPLKVKRNSNAADQQRLKSPAVPGMYDYGYTHSRLPYSGLAAPSYAAYPYVDRDNRSFADRPDGRYNGQPMASRYAYPRDYSVPRYTGHMPFAGHRFRPLNRPGWYGYPYRGQPDRYAAIPYPVPNYQRRMPGWRHQYAVQPGWYPQMTAPYPGMQRTMGWPDAPNRYGVDWYDGRGDGEGAWYQLAGRQEWPRISHYLPVD